MTRPNEKIRPPSHSSYQQKSDPALRAEAEGDLPERVSAPDPMANRVGPDEAVSAVAGTEPEAEGGSWDQEPPPGAFAPVAAAALRAQHNEPNAAYGRPYRPNEAERLLNEYNEANAAVKAAYAGTRNEPPELRTRFLLAKEAMIKAGLMKGDV